MTSFFVRLKQINQVRIGQNHLGGAHDQDLPKSLKLFENIDQMYKKHTFFSCYFMEINLMMSLFLSRDIHSYFYILLLAINDR